MPHLLFVDDQTNDFKVWGRPLERYGWEVVHASGPHEAKEQLRTAEDAGHPFDVVIIDRQMPDSESGEPTPSVGDELLKDIAARWRYVCPVMLTNFGGEEPAARATRHGAYRYLLKGTEVRVLNRV